MDPNSWADRVTSASKHYQSAQSRSGMKWDRFDAEMLMGFDEVDMDIDDIRDEYPCPFCTDYYDIVGLCCHIDEEHYTYNTNVECPVCAMRVGIDMVAHITLHHGNLFKMQHKRKSRKAGSHSTLSMLKRELREGDLQSLFGGSSRVISSTNVDPDPLLSSFILPMVEDYERVPLEHSSADSILVKKSTTYSISERKEQQPPMSMKDKEEKAKRCDFVQGLLWSMMLDDY